MHSDIVPQVSVVMSVYNGGRFSAEAIDSILRQTFADFELIIIDDASTDDTAAILASYGDPRIRRIKNTENLGLTRSLNLGISLAKGFYIARHDADDISEPDRLRQQVAFLRSHTGVGLVGTNYHIIDTRGQVLETVRLPATDRELRARIVQGNIFCHGSVMFRRDVLDVVGGYHEGFPVTQDYDLWLRLAEHSEIANLNAVLYHFRFASGTISRKKRGAQLSYRQLAKALAEQRRSTGTEQAIPDDVMSEYPPEPRLLLADARRAAYLHYVAGQRDEAAQSLARAQQTLKETCGDELARIPTWKEWILASAQQLARMRNDINAGVTYIHWVSDILTGTEQRLVVDVLIGRYYADQAFIAHEARLGHRVLVYAFQSVRCDPRWMRNRGLWAISLRSLLTGYKQARK
jgi:glycosyltransferase involved in cell wall biosynthesis